MPLLIRPKPVPRTRRPAGRGTAAAIHARTPSQRRIEMPRTRFPRLIPALLACAALLAAPSAGDAQTPVVRPGADVRIMAPSAADTLLSGTVVAIDSASLLLAPPRPGASRTVALRDIERLEVWGPGRSRRFTGMLLGTVAGAVAGYAVCHVASGSPHANCQKGPGAAFGAGVGLVLGGEIGSLFREPGRWVPAAVPRK
jgi:hypothetical protein